jgi:hypothetical protein
MWADALKKLDQYAKRVEQETLRHLYRFREHPEEYQDSEAYFRLMMMAVILQEDSKSPTIRSGLIRRVNCNPTSNFTPTRRTCSFTD